MAQFISLPRQLEGFEQHIEETELRIMRSGRENYLLPGELPVTEEQRVCHLCGGHGHIHGTRKMELSDLPGGKTLYTLGMQRARFKCPCCGATWMQDVHFKAEGHFITVHLLTFVQDLLERGLTVKLVAQLAGLCQNTVKDIDKKRLEGKYTYVGPDGRRWIMQPERQTRAIAVDEFKLHEGPVFVTIIIDLETGHVLWLAHGKKKQAVRDFINHVGKDWFDTVEAVSTDMNSDYQEIFEEEFDHIQVVFDHFHIVKNFNEKVIDAVRKDEQNRLKAEGDEEAAKVLKRSKYICCSGRKKLQEKDRQAQDGKIIVHEGILFPRMEKKASGGREERYDEILRQNRLLFIADFVKESLAEAYRSTDEIEMSGMIDQIIDTCRETENKHFIWFANLLENHYEGIIAHASLPFSTGKLEGTNNRIKAMIRQSYGFRDDEYLFLKIFDASRRDKDINPKSHRKSD